MLIHAQGRKGEGMRTLRGHSRNYSCVVVFICLGCLTFLSACGGSGGGNEGAAASASSTGSIAVNLEWEEPDSSGTSFTAQLSDIDVCVDYGIEEVSAVVKNASGTIVASELWDCKDHSGTIEDVPAGSNMSVAFAGLIGGSSKWEGEIGGLVVKAGETTTTQKVEMKWIPPFPSGDPAVRPTTPLDNQIEIPVTAVIKAKFSVDMAPSTINSTTFTLMDIREAEEIPCDVVYDPDSLELTMTPIVGLLASTTYEVNISDVPDDVVDKTGRTLTGVFQWSFKTVTWYKDEDGDGYSDGTVLDQVEQPDGYELAADLKGTSGDLDDNDGEVYPGAPEICDGKDNDCDGQVDEGLSTDVDKDGHYTVDSCFQPADDCNDNDASIYPGKAEVCDGKDNNCDGIPDEGLSTDADKDGHYTVGSCFQPADDCNDNDGNIYPGKAEVCDGKDNDCDGQVDEGLSTDADKDGHYTVGSCFQPADDCNDNDGNIYFGKAEVCDGKDNDCDGQVDEGLSTDADKDGHYTVGSCLKPADDCNDSDGNIFPGKTEVCDNKDNNCDGQVDEGLSTDADKDGHYTVGSCLKPADDCNDSDGNIFPGKAEVCDAKDNNCDGQVDEGLSTDADKDGHYTVGSCLKPADDCNDSDGNIFPGKAEVCDAKDNNCDGQVDEGLRPMRTKTAIIRSDLA